MMERRVTSHTEEEEMNLRRKLLTLARSGDEKAIKKLYELYQVVIYSGDRLRKGKGEREPSRKLARPKSRKAKSVSKRIVKKIKPHPTRSSHSAKPRRKKGPKTKKK